MYATAMEEYSCKRAAGGLVVPRKGSSLVLREKADNNKDQNAQFCNRLGCSGRLHYSKGSTQTVCSEKPKSVRTSLRSTGKEMIGGSTSKTLSGVSNSRRTFQPSQKNVSNKLELDSTDRGSSSSSSSTSSTSVQDKIEVSERKDAESSKVQSMQIGSSSAASNPKSRRIFRQKSALGNQDAQLNSPVSSATSASKSTGHVARDGASDRNGLRTLRCNLTLDVIPQVSSSSESNSRGKELARKRIPEKESTSSVKGKKLSGPSSLSTSGSMSISECSRRNRNWPSTREISAAASSVRTRRSMNFSSRVGRPNQVNGNNSSSRESPVGFSQVNQTESVAEGNVSNLSNHFIGESSSSRSSSYILPTNDSDRLHNSIRTSSMELGISRLTNRDGSQQYNMDGIAEVLLALERIEQNEELTYEQLLVLESNLVLGGLSFYDQHRDMRLDIDNMSYEELLALEEKMGNVSTALSEEALINCLRRSIYHHPISHEECTLQISGDGDLTKCSICQEEYVEGDEIGRLGCEHGYHALCIQHWLRLKNWCPICKGSAAPASASASASSS